ncbi:GntR family transcriptional regulator [Streptomyces sp. NPDC005840]|uniref:GntR family transcriptional regulator n=1 Tax=Streptomyces sp. NPDC005840 TaxID=3157072 RepID=UPI0033FE059F
MITASHPHSPRTAAPTSSHRLAQTARALRRLLGRSYQHGDVLPPVAVLADHLGVSQDQLFEALARLAWGRQVVAVPGKGIVRTDPSTTPGARLLVRRGSGLTQNWALPSPAPEKHVQATLIRRITSGAYPPGERLPSRRDLAREFGISSHRVAKAVAPLIDRGILVLGTQPWQGCTVHPDAVTLARRDPVIDILRRADPGLPPGYLHVRDLAVRAAGTRSTARLTPSERTLYRSSITAAHDAGASRQEIADLLRRSLWVVARYLGTNPQADRVEALIDDKIQSGAYPIRHALPPRRQLARDLDATTSAVDLAVDRLCAAGALQRFPGCGTVVMDPDQTPTASLLIVRAPSGREQLRTVPPAGRSSTITVREAVVRRILTGVYPEGGPIPSQAQLSAEFTCSDSVVRRALDPLRSVGVLLRLPAGPHRRTTVHPAARHILSAHGVRSLLGGP